MPHDWTTAPEAEWRAFVADHLERMATNQMDYNDGVNRRLTTIANQYVSLDNKLSAFCATCSNRHMVLETRITKVEGRIGTNWKLIAGAWSFITLMAAAIVAAFWDLVKGR